MIFIVIFTIFQIIILAYFYISFQRSYRLWSSQSVPYLPHSFPSGNLSLSTVFTNFGDAMHDIYKKFRSQGDWDYGGLFFLNKPVLVVLSPEFARIVMARDFTSFVNRGVYYDRAGDPLSANLFFIEDDEWRVLRSQMTRTFTTAKIRSMFPPLHQVGLELMEHMRMSTAGYESDGRSMEITEFLFRFNTDVIGSCAFGIRCNTLVNSKSEFRQIGKKMLTFSRVQLFKLYVAMLFRREARAIGFRLVDKNVSKFITSVVRESIELRRSSSVRQNDFLQLMIDLLGEESIDEDRKVNRLSVDDIAANVFVFFFAGFETSSTSMAYALYELAQNPDIQQKARDEIEKVTSKFNGEITYESMAEMIYLEQVLNGIISFIFNCILHFYNLILIYNIFLALTHRINAQTSGSRNASQNLHR